MDILFYSAKDYDEEYFLLSNKKHHHKLRFTENSLTEETVSLLQGETAVCVFVNDRVNSEVLHKLSLTGVKLIALRCAGYNNVDLDAAHKLGIKVVRVPAYSPNAVAEHAVALMLALNRKIVKANAQVRENNFSLQGLLGFDFSGRTIGIIGTGKIGAIVARIMLAMGMKVLAYDLCVDAECEKRGVVYTSLDELLEKSDVISLHCPLTPDTSHIVNKQSIDKMKPGVMLINTSRGGVLDTCAVIDAVKEGKIGYLGLDVYEHESDLFFKDLSCVGINDTVFEDLLALPNVLITAHQAFFTADALTNIADTTLNSFTQFESGLVLETEISFSK